MTRRLSRRETIKMIGGTLAALPLARWPSLSSRAQERTAPPPQERLVPRDAPNIIFIMTDDQRQDAMSAYGNRILRTPQMDRIGAEGVRFTEAFVTNSLCAPSRASFLTGLYSHRHGVLTNGASNSIFRNQPGLSADQATFVSLLQHAGYHTALVGKWHLRSQPVGFDHWVILPGGGGPYMDPEMIANGVRVKLRGHADDVVGDQALTYLQQRPRERPFCLLYHFKSPHRNWIPAPRFERAFEDVEIPVPRTFEDRLEGRPEALRRAEMAVADMPDFRERGVPASLPPAERRRRNLAHLVKNYYRTMLSVDENVGRVLDFLDRHDLSRNTIVIYTSDNGFFLGEHGLYDKRLMYEPSIRVPLLARFPARFRAGIVDTRRMVLNVDVAPTLLELAGVPAPLWMQGRSFVPLLEGRAAPWRDAFFYEFFEYPAEHCAGKHRGVRTARWKLIHFWEQPEEWELYDLQNDPEETNNLARRREHAARVRELRTKMEELRRELGDMDPPGPAPAVVPCHAYDSTTR